MKYYIIAFVSMLILFSSCSRKNIIITKEYIKNDYWNSKLKEYNEIQVLRLKLKDSIPSGKNYSLGDYVNNEFLEIDSVKKEQNCWADIPKKTGRKIYFDNEYDNWDWYCCDFFSMDDKHKKKSIGKLKNNTWYLFNNLRDEGVYNNKYLVYIYVDENGEIHKFIRNLVNI